MSLTPSALTDAIEAGYELEWKNKKPNPLPESGTEDRRLLFAGIARGILQYLYDHHDELVTTITTQDSGGGQTTLDVVAANLGIDVS
jgi:hypothetical protein